MGDERTLATEIRELFQGLGSSPDMIVANAWAEHLGTQVGSERFFLGLSLIRGKLDRLIIDIDASPLKERSKSLYKKAVNQLAEYTSIQSMQGNNIHSVRANTQAFEYLTLVDDFLVPLDHRDIPNEALASLRAQVIELRASLDDVEMDKRLKSFLITQFANLIWALDHFDAIGIEGLCRTFGASHAEFARSIGLTGASKPEALAWYKKAWPAFGAIGLAITSLSAVVEHTDNLLTHGESLYDRLIGVSEKPAGAKKTQASKTADRMIEVSSAPRLPKP